MRRITNWKKIIKRKLIRLYRRTVRSGSKKNYFFVVLFEATRTVRLYCGLSSNCEFSSRRGVTLFAVDLDFSCVQNYASILTGDNETWKLAFYVQTYQILSVHRSDTYFAALYGIFFSSYEIQFLLFLSLQIPRPTSNSNISSSTIGISLNFSYYCIALSASLKGIRAKVRINHLVFRLFSFFFLCHCHRTYFSVASVDENIICGRCTDLCEYVFVYSFSFDLLTFRIFSQYLFISESISHKHTRIPSLPKTH